MEQKGILKTRLLSSLEKVFADEELKSAQWNSGSALLNEVYSFQIAYNWNAKFLKKVQVKVVSDLLPWITIRKVELVTSEMPCFINHDDNILRATPGLYPDPLATIGSEGITLLPNQWRSIWITVSSDAQVKPGTYPIEIIFQTDSGEELGKDVFQLSLISAELPKQSLIHTEWFHTDCLATWYEVDVFSEEHWKRIEQYIQAAVRHGVNMILTPIFTPPLDTEVGGERPTVQLVDVEKSGDIYKFGFDKFERWVDICLSNGVEYFEFSHLFTQWGAGHAPKIMAAEGGELKRIFGWETDAIGDEYKNFLAQFLPELIKVIEKNGLKQRSYFHVSDEPKIGHIENYKSASSMLKVFLSEFPIIDALSDFEF